MSRRIYIKNLIMRGLAIALSFLAIATLVTPVHAYTSNELREYIGLEPNYYGEENTYNIRDSLNNQNNNVKSQEDIKSEEIIVNSQREVNLTAYDDEITEINDRLQSRLHNGTSAYIIVTTVDELIVAMNKKLDASANSTNKYSTDSKIQVAVKDKSNVEDTDEDMLRVMAELTEESVTDISSLDFDIGGLGSSATYPVSTHAKIVTPYGFTKSVLTDKYTSSKLLGVDWDALKDTEIVSMWNGVVVAIGTDESRSFQYIKIYHGNSTYTTYSHIYVKRGINVGDFVLEGQVIATAADTTSFEPAKNNHIFHQIKLNGEYINPLLVYGENGKKLYEQWLTSNAMDNVVESDEEYFNDKKIVEDYHVENPDEYTLPVINWEELYG